MSSGAVNGIYFKGFFPSTPRSVIYVAVRLLSDDSRFVRSQWRKNRTSVLSACQLVLYILLFGPGIAVYNTHTQWELQKLALFSVRILFWLLAVLCFPLFSSRVCSLEALHFTLFRIFVEVFSTPFPVSFLYSLFFAVENC